MRDTLLLLHRSAQIVAVIGRLVLIPEMRARLGAGSGAAPRAVRVRQAFEQLGGAWIKIGQTLALRFDLLPPEYCTEFLKLLNEAKPFPLATVRLILREEFGRDPEEVFARFDPEPLAAASIAQVHRATSFAGEPLAVKIQRPGVGRLFAADFLVMRCVAFGLDLARSFNGTSMRGIIDEFARWTEEEIDFRVEARNTHRMSLCTSRDPLQVDTRVHFDLSSERVLTTDFIDGISLLDIVRAVQSSDQAYLDDVARRGYDLTLIGRHICWNMLNQMFRNGFFHADLHPANLFALPGNAIGYVDYGIVGRLSEETRESLRYYIRCLFQGKFDSAVEELMRWVTPSALTDIGQARRELVSVLEDYRYGLGPNAGGPLQLTSGFLVNIMSVFRNNNLTMSQTLTLYFKAVLTTDAVVFELNPEYDLFTDIELFFRAEQAADAREALSMAGLPQKIWAANFNINKSIFDFGKIHNATHTVEITMDTLRTRLFLYYFWAAMIVFGTFAFHYGPLANVFRSSLGIVYGWISFLLYATICILLLVMWRQGNRLAAVDHRAFGTRKITDRPR